jgi:telomerase Cajal body protein 1
VYPRADYARCHVAVCQPGMPIHVYDGTLADSKPVASYHLINPLLEEYMPIRSLIFSPDGARLLAGTQNMFAIYDVSRPGEEPQKVHTRPPKKARVHRIDQGIHGLISTMSVNSVNRILAAGSFDAHINNVGLYDFSDSLGSAISAFTVCEKQTGSGGIIQVKWSPDGNYLNVCERKSSAIHVFDIRNLTGSVSILRGRSYSTAQKLQVDVIGTAHGYELWAGGTDGKVCVWSNPGSIGGDVEPTFTWQAHEDTVVSTLIHSSGTVAVTAAQPTWQKTNPNLWDDSSSDSDNEKSSGMSNDESSSSSDKEDSESASKEDENVQDEVGKSSMIKIWSV